MCTDYWYWREFVNSAHCINALAFICLMSISCGMLWQAKQTGSRSLMLNSIHVMSLTAFTCAAVYIIVPSARTVSLLCGY